MNLLEQYLKKWHLIQPEPFKETTTSTLYKVKYQNKTSILKILTPIGLQFESYGASALKCFNGKGAVQVLAFDKKALLLEFISGIELSQIVKQKKNDKATEIICDVLDDLHSYSGALPKNIHNLETQFESLFARTQSKAAPEIFHRTALVAQQLIKTEINQTLLHGDIHHHNILLSSQRGWVSIDPQPFFGERTYDTANAFFNPDFNIPLIERDVKNRIESMASIFSKHLDVSYKRVLMFAFAYGGLSSSWQIEDGNCPNKGLYITKVIGSLLGQ